MSTYAYLDERGYVIDVIEGKDPEPGHDWAKVYARPGSTCVHAPGAGVGWLRLPDGTFQPPNPGSGYTWDAVNDEWVAPTIGEQIEILRNEIVQLERRR